MSKYSKVMAVIESEYEFIKFATEEWIDEYDHPTWSEEFKEACRTWFAGQRDMIEELLEKIRAI